MKVLVILLVSCGPPVQYKDSILMCSNIKNNMCGTFKIRMYNKKINRYEIKTIRVCDYRAGETIK